jgi:hypothetical protein
MSASTELFGDFPVHDDGSFFDCRSPLCRAPARRYVVKGQHTGNDVVRYLCDEHRMLA